MGPSITNSRNHFPLKIVFEIPKTVRANPVVPVVGRIALIEVACSG